jgi:hypothetical protein
MTPYPKKPASIMYHAAPSRLWEDIDSGGLVPGEQRHDQTHPPGVYLYDTYQEAARYGEAFGSPHDIWAVNVEGLPVQPDPENGPDEYDGRYYHPGEIPVERVWEAPEEDYDEEDGWNF